MESKKINQLATNVAPVSSDLTIIGDPTTGVSKKVTLSQIASLFAGAVDFYANLAAFPASGTLNTIYCAKDTQKLYLWSGSAYVEVFPSQAVLNTYQLISAKGVANGYASLDASGKVPIGELPSSIMEYKGLWSAATNTPTLANGTGDTGDVYICSAAGSVNFGAGAITFAVGDYVIYSGTIWQRSSGAVGTVTSVGLSSATSGVTIGSSPITTSGTITLAIATATTSQNGLLSSVDWATFNGKESVLTFSSPLVRTTNTISIPAATTSVNGYLASADFTTFNNKQNAITLTTTGTSGVSTLVGATLNIPDYGSALTGYVTLATTQTITGAKTFSGYTTFTSTVDITSGLTFSNSGFTLVLQPPTLSVNRTVTLPNGTGTLALTSDISYPVTSVFGRTGAVVATSGDYTTAQVTEVTNLYFTDSRARLAISLTTTGTSGAATYNNTTGVLNIPQYTDQFVGTVTSVAALTIGTSGTDLSSTVATSTTTPVITLNVPTASAANRGALASADWTTFNNKQSALTNPVLASGTWTSGYLPKINGTYTIGNSILQETGGFLLTDKGTSTMFGVAIATSSSNGGNLTIKAGGGFGSGNTAGNLYLGYGRGNSSASNGAMYFGMAQPTDAVGLASTHMTLDASGNLGLGVTPSAWAVKAIDISTTGAVFGDGIAFDYTAGISQNCYRSGNTTWNYKLTGVGTSRFELNGNIFSWYQVPSGTAGNAITFTQAMTLFSTGNLAVGTTTDNSSRLNILSSSASIATFTGATNGYIDISDGIVNSRIQNSGGLFIGTLNSYDLNLRTNATTRLTINASTGAATFSSSVTAAGSTSNSSLFAGTLEMQSYSLNNGWYAENAYFNGSSFKYRATGFASRIAMYNGEIYLDNAVSGAANGNLSWVTALLAHTSGNVTIGSGGDNGFKLEVLGTSNVTGAATFSSSVSVGDFLRLTKASNVDIQAYTGSAYSNLNYDALSHNWQTSGGTAKMVLNASGNVGIGTNSPLTTLTVKSTNDNGYALTRPSDATTYHWRLSTTETGADAYYTAYNTFNCEMLFSTYASGGTGGNIIWRTGSSGAGSLTERFRITPSGTATFTSSVTATGFFESSDSRLKTLIQDNYQTKGIASITPKLYTKNGKVELGYYAQDFVGILDSAVSKGSDNMLSLSYREVLVAKVYALEQEIKELKAKMN